MRGLLLLGMMLAVAVLAGCDRAGQSGSSGAPLGPEERRGERVPDFQIVAYQGADVLGGQEIRFSELLAQDKPVVLNFWAGACPPCRVEMPHFQEVAQRYEGEVLVFGLDVGPFVGLGSREDGQALLNDLRVTFPAGTTFDGQVVRDYQLLGMPTTFFITSDGTIAKKWTGLLSKDKLTELVEDLLEVNSGA